MSDTVRNNERFCTTRWTIVSTAGDLTHRGRMAALEHLCMTYRAAIVLFLKASGKSIEDAEDLTQQFFTHLLTHDTLSRAQESRGKFRSFLLACVTNFSRDQFKKERALKRGGGIVFEDVDFANPADHSKRPDKAFDRKWAETVIEQAMSQLESESLSKGKPFVELKPYLVDAKGDLPFEQQAKKMGISKSALKSAVYRLRQRYARLVRKCVAETISDEQSLEDELRSLMAILSE